MSSWALKRQLLYLGVILLAGVIIASGIVLPVILQPASCSDNIRNGKEEGVDCGGTCGELCGELVTPLRIAYARPFLLEGNEWGVVARIENANQKGYAVDTQYTIRLVDEVGSLIAERRGVVSVAPAQNRYVLESRIVVGSRNPARAYISLEKPRLWLPHTTADVPTLTVSNEQLVERNGLYRVTAQVHNQTTRGFSNTIVVAVVFDAQGVARSGGQTLIRTLERDTSADVVFTWPTSFDFTPTRVEVLAYPVI